ncbi:MAG: hypothetical protein H7039_07775 [Bryobacteraceae bacterium]|nr:hypothetical protein [Bryobacteraceae bacterium]
MSVPEQLNRILASQEFRDSQRMCRFLRFVVERALAGEATALKEYLIGVEVFDRKEGYDPRVDPIVRVEARRLRSKLSSYYERDGRGTGPIIELPKGTYAPVFHNVSLPVPSAAPDPHRDRTIAVLPFTNLTADPESEYFTDGLTEELTHVLTKVPGLQVVSWNSTAKMKGHPVDPAAVAEQLQADVFVRGSVRSARGRMRIMAQLLEAPRGIVLWSETFDRNPEDIFEVQDEIATAIAQSLQLRLIETPRSGPNMEVYNLYLKGRYHWNTRTPDGLRKSVECFQQAISLEPQYALAHAGLADAWTILVDYGALPSDQLQVAEQAARKAIEIDPSLAEPYAALALIRSIYWNWDESEDLYRRSLSLNPNYSTAHHWIGIDHMAMLGRFDEALHALEKARQLDPLSMIIPEGKALLYMLWERYPQSLAVYQELSRRDSQNPKIHAGMGRLHIQMGFYDRACELLDLAWSRNGNSPSILGALGQAQALSGRPVQARATLRCLTELSERRHVSSACFGIIHMALGETEKALDCLELAAHRHDAPVLALGVHPLWNPLRSEPRFRALLQRLNLEEAEERAQSYRKAAQ